MLAGDADKDATVGKPSEPTVEEQQQPQQQVEQQVELLDPAAAVPPQQQPTEEGTTAADAKPPATDVEAVTEPAVSPPGPVRADADNTGMRPVNAAPAIPPFFLELLQPFQQPSRRYPPYHYQQQQQQQPYPLAHVPVDPFNPFASPIVRMPSFDQLFNVYNNEFRREYFGRKRFVLVIFLPYPRRRCPSDSDVGLAFLGLKRTALS